MADATKATSTEDDGERQRVDHTYRDFSRYLEEGGPVAWHKKAGTNFPALLHQLLSEPRFSHIISWMPHGRAWRINDKELLMHEAVPKYFSQTKYESFTRQLGCWGFKRLHQPGPDFGCYYHECFLRGLPELTPLMMRTPTNNGRGKLAPDADGEPDFYEISREHPVPLGPEGAAHDRDDAATPDASFMTSSGMFPSFARADSGATSTATSLLTPSSWCGVPNPTWLAEQQLLTSPSTSDMNQDMLLLHMARMRNASNPGWMDERPMGPSSSASAAPGPIGLPPFYPPSRVSNAYDGSTTNDFPRHPTASASRVSSTASSSSSAAHPPLFHRTSDAAMESTLRPRKRFRTGPTEAPSAASPLGIPRPADVANAPAAQSGSSTQSHKLPAVSTQFQQALASRMGRFQP